MVGVGFKSSYFFGGFGVWIKLFFNDFFGIVIMFYMFFLGFKYCEFDFEFLGNCSYEFFLLYINIFVDGVGRCE